MIKTMSLGNHIHRLLLNAGGATFDLELRGHITVFEGDSSTGKTYFFNAILEDYTNNHNAYNELGINGVLFVNAANLIADIDYKILLDRLKQQKRWLVLIDNGDKVLHGRNELLRYILLDTVNQYIIASRRGIGLNVSLNHFGELKQVGNKITSEFYYNEKGWM